MAVTNKITVTRAELADHARWPDHDPGDEDEPSWLRAPLAPKPARPTLFDRLLVRWSGGLDGWDLA